MEDGEFSEEAYSMNISETEGKKKPKSEDLIIEAKNFFNFNKEDLGESIRKRTNVIFLDFIKLAEFSNKLSEEIILNPEETLSIIELAIEELGLVKNARIRLKNLHEGYQIKIRNIRSKHLNELIMLEGIIRQASDVRPQVVNAKFECPSCGTIISVLQIEKKFREPSRCSCGRRGGFRLISKDMVDTQRLVVEESPESLSGGEQPKRINIFVKEDLVEPRMEEKTTPGAKIKVIGVLKEVPVPLSTGGLSTRFELAIEANNIIPLEETFEELDINDEDERQIQEISEDPKIFENLAKSIIPSVWGYEEIKKALVLQLFGGVQKQMSDGSKSRGDIHILLIGDPGVAKSVTLNFMANISPKGRYVVGKSTSGAGLTATVVRDEYLKGWSLEAGAMVLANKGLVCLHPDTMIIADNKIKKISSLFNENNIKEIKLENGKAQINDKITQILTWDKKYNFHNSDSSMIRRKHYSGNLIKIDFESGFSIRLTPDHQLVDGNSMLWKEAKEFNESEFVFAPLKLPSHNKKVYLLDIIPDNWIVCLNKEEKREIKEKILQNYENLSEFNKIYSLDRNILSGGKQFNIKLFKQILNDLGIYDLWKEKNLSYGRSKSGERLRISEITPELSYLAGFSLGDGHIKSDKKHSLLQITQSTKNYKQIERLRYYFNKTSYRKLGEYKRNSQSVIKDKLVYSEHKVLYSGSNLICYLINHFIENKLNNILELSDENMKAFIAGCLDSDGCISTKNYIKKGNKYEITHSEFLISNDYELNKNLMLALRRLDCYSRLVEQKPICIIRTTGNLDVLHLLNSVKDYSVKYREIPLRKDLISSSSSKIPAETAVNICRRITDEIKTSELNSAGISSVIYDYINKNRQPSREQLIKIKNKLNLSRELNNEIELVAKRDYFLDKIIKISKEKYEGYVYDLLVPKTHNFIAEGIVVHNCIDELEKMDPQDRSAMHEAMEQQTVTISKANVQATLKAQTSVLAAANPKFGRFDPFMPIPQQIDLPPTLINRFDIIFTLRDIPDRIKDEKIATHVLKEHQKDTKEAIIDTSLFRKYIAYAKQKIIPKLSSEAVEELKRFYIELRNKPVTSESAMRPIPISARQLQALIRMAEASAKIRLSENVSKEDARQSIELMKYYLMQVGYDYESKTFDIDKITGKFSASQRNKIFLVKETITALESKMGKMIPYEEIEKELEDKIGKDELEEVINRLIRDNEIYRPKKGYIGVF